MAKGRSAGHPVEKDVNKKEQNYGLLRSTLGYGSLPGRAVRPHSFDIRPQIRVY